MGTQVKWRRVALALAALSLVIFVWVVGTHVHPANESPNDCPLCAAHLQGGTAIVAPEVPLTPPSFTAWTFPPMRRLTARVFVSTAAFAARAPPLPA